MVSFSCENCGDVLTKKKLDSHRSHCRGASFSCLDCQTTFQGTDYRSHTSCISEAQKYEKGLHKPKKAKQQQQNSAPPTPVESQALVPRNAFQEPPTPDNRVAIVDAPPAAPSPPPNVNVFDFLITDGGPSRASLTPDDSDDQWEDEMSDDMHPEPSYPDPPPYSESVDPVNVFQYQVDGFEYGSEPVKRGLRRFDSFVNLPGAYPNDNMGNAFTTPAPNKAHSRTISVDSATGKKRKRGHPDNLDLSTARAYPANGDVVMTDVAPPLHSGLTGGLRHLLSRTEFPPSPDYSGGDGADALPMSPLKRPKVSEKDRIRSQLREKDRKKSSSKEKSRDKDRSKDKDRDRSKHREHKKSRRESRESESKRSNGFWVQERRRPRKHSASPEPVEPQRTQLAIEYHPTHNPAEPTTNGTSGAMILHSSAIEKRVSTRADLFMSFVTKGPDSDRGCSINKVLKRYHRERGSRIGKVAEEKELWKVLRLRRNDRGEIVLFTG